MTRGADGDVQMELKSTVQVFPESLWLIRMKKQNRYADSEFSVCFLIEG